MDATTPEGPAIKAKAWMARIWATLKERYPKEFVIGLFCVAWGIGALVCFFSGVDTKPENSYLAVTWDWLSSYWNSLVGHFPANFWRILSWPLEIGSVIFLWIIDIVVCLLWWILRGSVYAFAAVTWFTFIWSIWIALHTAFIRLRDWRNKRRQEKNPSGEYIEVEQLPHSGEEPEPSGSNNEVDNGDDGDNDDDDDATLNEDDEPTETPLKSKDDSMV